jgi:hypothetical protein
VTTDPKQEQSGGLGLRLASPLFRVLATALFLVAIGGIAVAVGATSPSGSSKANGCVRTFGQYYCRGPQGPRGATGPKGAKGRTGATGRKGATGARGAKGQAGATGPTGPQGLDGTQGTTGVGGASGATGATGPNGVTGPAGTPGATGPTGSLASAYLEAHTTVPQILLPGNPLSFDTTDASNGIFLLGGGDTATVGSTGTYELNVTLSGPSTSGSNAFSYSVNGASVGPLLLAQDSGDAATTMRIVSLNAGDTVQIVNSGSSVALTKPGSTLELIRIG